jgi:hypothetical protein
MPILIPQMQNTDIQLISFTTIYETVRFRTVSDAKPNGLEGGGYKIVMARRKHSAFDILIFEIA